MPTVTRFGVATSLAAFALAWSGCSARPAGQAPPAPSPAAPTAAPSASPPEQAHTFLDAQGMRLDKDVPASLRPWLGRAAVDRGAEPDAATNATAWFKAELATGNVRLSLDASMHRSLHAAFEGVERGAGAVLDARTGQIRALFSTLPHNTQDGLASRHWATSDPRNPGSTFKPFTAVAGASAGQLDATTRHVCKGVVPIGKRTFRCWGTHGKLDVARALAISDNAFFFYVARAMKHDDLARVQHHFGLGQPVALPPGSSPGWVPMQEVYEVDGQSVRPGHTLNQSIGHGEVRTTPLQLARAYAALATGSLPELSLTQPRPGKAIDARHEPMLTLVRKALVDAVHAEGGSAYSKAAPDAAGKTGTASAPTSDPTVRRKLGWFAGWAPAHDPQVAFAFVVQGNSGPETARRVLAWLHAQGAQGAAGRE